MASAATGKDLLIIGPGVLGSLVGSAWLKVRQQCSPAQSPPSAVRTVIADAVLCVLLRGRVWHR